MGGMQKLLTHGEGSGLLWAVARGSTPVPYKMLAGYHTVIELSLTLRGNMLTLSHHWKSKWSKQITDNTICISTCRDDCLTDGCLG